MIYIFSRIGGPAQLAKLNPVVNARIYSQQSGFGNNSAPIKVVSKAALIDLLKKPTFVLVDVRKRYEVERGMIPTAVNIPRNNFLFKKS
jgi:predicted sulfurtransferase